MGGLMWFFFFFKQKTAYEMLRSLVGSEMCIRDSPRRWGSLALCSPRAVGRRSFVIFVITCLLWTGVGMCTSVRSLSQWHGVFSTHTCLLYTSDAADEEDSVDLGGRRIIKKKKK
eukprot:TRINITY_DN4118_c0_g1_i4.p1 TRINITY_DN4118_c0_g1~~TRINITY_DN4118_c0_g1_i4.p1  ORF type:complete len:115 (-),score=34.68 TRINITY_DN4118_c0_g1_i4:82-426(-)